MLTPVYYTFPLPETHFEVRSITFPHYSIFYQSSSKFIPKFPKNQPQARNKIQHPYSARTETRAGASWPNSLSSRQEPPPPRRTFSVSAETRSASAEFLYFRRRRRLFFSLPHLQFKFFRFAAPARWPPRDLRYIYRTRARQWSDGVAYLILVYGKEDDDCRRENWGLQCGLIFWYMVFFSFFSIFIEGGGVVKDVQFFGECWVMGLSNLVCYFETWHFDAA